MHIREYRSEDRQDCIGIFKSNMPLYFAEKELPEFEQWLNSLDAAIPTGQKIKAAHYFIGEKDKQVIACAGFHVLQNQRSATMAWGMVDPIFQKQGIGTELLQYRIRLVETVFPGYRILLDTTQHSFRFFEKLGFSLVKITEDYYAGGLHRYDMEYGS